MTSIHRYTPNLRAKVAVSRPNSSLRVKNPDAKQTNFETRLLGMAIRRARKRLGLTQSQLASALGVHLQTVNRYEKGHIETTPTRLRQIGEALGVDLLELLEDGVQAAQLPDSAENEETDANYLLDRSEQASAMKGMRARIGAFDAGYALAVFEMLALDAQRMMERALEAKARVEGMIGRAATASGEFPDSPREPVEFGEGEGRKKA
jgi:transcriptional regulator with XRE-family HTH domain